MHERGDSTSGRTDGVGLQKMSCPIVVLRIPLLLLWWLNSPDIVWLPMCTGKAMYAPFWFVYRPIDKWEAHLRPYHIKQGEKT